MKMYDPGVNKCILNYSALISMKSRYSNRITNTTHVKLPRY